ncbi:type II secretion system protein GspL [Alginatibacterium sediminis]|uniref:Type II secretion system protein L n=1 Tax=Alginatibacterium sediminis TaxID=2164068 RepID=A0A420E6E0_9ALTE|nr:type II secretion system protein GspL [Alginatibacterium sediminis]RKF13191.1 type II secretion system protein GspL [Alginatibacterium sediminis]
MNETLILHWPASKQSSVMWVVYDNLGAKLISSGQCKIEQLSELQTKTKQRQVIVLMPARLCRVISLELAKSAQRKWRKLVPYMLEDELAHDPEELHFALLKRQATTMSFVVCQKQYINQILDQLNTLEIKLSQLVPDALLLEQEGDNYTGLRIDDEWLLRGPELLFCGVKTKQIEFVLAAIAAQTKLTDNSGSEIVDETTEDAAQPLRLQSYHALKLSPSLEQDWEVHALEPQLPLEVLAQGLQVQQFSLLQGEFEAENPWRETFAHWKKVLVAASICLALLVGEQYLELRQLQAQSQQTTEQLRDLYKEVFPNARRFRDSQIQRDFKRVLAQQASGGLNPDIEILIALEPAFAKVPDLDVSSLRFDQSRGELRVQAQADSYQSFDKFSRIASDFEVEQGAMSQGKNKVQGSLVIRSRQ